MAIFPMSGVLRRFILSTYDQYADKINPCAALLIKKIYHLKTENSFSPNYSLKCWYRKSVIPDEFTSGERDPRFDRPFDMLTVLSKIEGLSVLREVEGEYRMDK